MISKQKKPVENPKKPVEKPKKPVEKPKKPVEKPKKSVEKPKKPVEKPKKSVEKPKKPVEKPKKSVEKTKIPVPKKRVKNVNVDKIINIIKKYIIKCGIENPKLKRRGGSKFTEFFVKGVKNIASAAQSLTTKKIGNIDNECFENLKEIDVVFASIKDDVINARKQLLEFLESRKTNSDDDIFKKLKDKYEFIDTKDDAFKFYNYKYNTEIKIEFILDDIEKIEINNYLILYTIDIVAQLELYREGMLLCARHPVLGNTDTTKEIKDYINTKLDLFESKKESILNSVASSASAVPVASATSVASSASAVPVASSASAVPVASSASAAPMSSSVSVAPIRVVESDVAPLEDVYEDAVEYQKETSLIQHPLRGSLLDASTSSSRSSASSTRTLASRRPDQMTGTPPLESVTSSRSTSSDEIMSASPQLTSSFSSISRSSPGRIQTSSPPTKLRNRNSGAPYGNNTGSTYV
jgi:hypothetical protein